MGIVKLWGWLGCALALMLGGCAAQAVPAAPPSPAQQLLLREAAGGLCSSGQECRATITFRTDGSWTALGAGSRRDGQLSATELGRLREATAATGLASAPPATETCPLAYDGQEITYTWNTGGAEFTAASCTVSFDPADPLVVTAEGLVAAIN
jgi:hypothetical protein